MITQTTGWELVNCVGADGVVYVAFENMHSKKYAEFEVNVDTAKSLFYTLGERIKQAEQ